MRSLIMRSLILSLLVLQLLLPGAYSEAADRKSKKPLTCKNPKAKEGQSTWQGCSTATCQRIGKLALWQPCPEAALEKTVKGNDEKLEKNHEMSLEILKILGNCCPTITTWDPAPTTLISDVVGGWGNWGNWASCDSTGTKKRTRRCDSPPPKNGGASCAGSSQDSTTCTVNGKWSPWGTWASCDSSSGTKKRMRQCDSPSPKNGGESCAGSSQESENCPVDGKWSPWGTWASCDSSSGTKKRMRQCDSPSPKNGGEPCDGSSQESENCPVVGGWSNWGNWASCDSTGTKKRTRRCDSPPPKNGGASCAGSSQDSATCPGYGDPTSNSISRCDASYNQGGYHCSKAIDGNLGTGWAYLSKLPAWLVVHLDNPGSTNTIIIKTGWSRSDHHINDFSIEVKVGNSWEAVKVTKVNSAGATIQGNKVKIGGQKGVRVAFEKKTDVSAVRINAYGSDAGNDNSVLNMIFVLNLVNVEKDWSDNVDLILNSI